MPRNVSDIYFIPPGTEGFPDTTIESEKYNTYIHDVETDLNRPRPISAGGTGADDADEALANLHAEKAGQVVDNFDSYAWMAGSFYSSITATGAPVAGHAFSGIVYKTDSGDFVVEARDVSTGFVYTRVQTSGVWSVWGRTDAPLTCADDPPTGMAALDNSLWFESSTGLLFVRYNDGDSSQWCIACPQPDISTYAIKTEAVAKTGDTMSGPLVLSASPPIADLEAANKKYVDDTASSTTSAAIDAKAVRYDAPQMLASAGQAQARSNIGVPDTSLAICPNSIINGDFRVNQSGYISAAVLSAGAYGHDQWKAGASGGDYSFTQLKSSTQITIASGKSLIQPIEDTNVAGSPYVLSWVGTAQARAGVNTLTPSGSYAGSPLLIAGQNAGTVMSIEFSSGTLGSVKLERGSMPTPFSMRPFGEELAACLRYYEKSYDYETKPGTVANNGRCSNTTSALVQFDFVRIWAKRVVPTVTLYSPITGASGKASVVDLGSDATANPLFVGTNNFSVQVTFTAAGQVGLFHWTADARL